MVELLDHDQASLQHEVTSLLAALRPDGVILTPPSSDSAMVLDMLRATRTPCARLGPEQDTGGGLRLRLDEAGAVHGMVDHLVGLGHRRIGFVEGEQRYASSQSRRRGFEQGMLAHGLKTPWMQAGDDTYQFGVLAGHSILSRERRPTAILCGNDDMALGYMAAATELSLEVPGDISVTGFDDSGGARFSRPQLTTVRLPLVELAEMAARALIEGSVTSQCNSAQALGMEPFSLVIRASTSAPKKPGAPPQAPPRTRP